MKVIEHVEDLKLCPHGGDTWGVALANALVCLGVEASIPDEVTIVDAVMRGKGAWHRGHLLTGRTV